MGDISYRQLQQELDRLATSIREATGDLPDGSRTAVAKRRQRARQDRLWFFAHYLPHLFPEPMGEHHAALGKELDAHPILLVLAFRGWGKSTYVTYAETLRLLMAGGVEFAVLTSRTEDKTLPFVLQLRTELEHNARLAQDFGPFAPGAVWQADHFALANGKEVRGLPLGGSSRGLRSLRNKRPQLWVLDDLQELKDAKNPDRIGEIVEFIGSVVIPAMDARRSTVRIVGTKMSEIYSNFASAMYQEPGAPQPRGVWSMETLIVGSGIAAKGVGSFDTVNAAFGLNVLGRPQQLLQQRVAAAKYSVQIIATAAFSTCMVACISPVFSDSTLLVRAEISGVANPQITGISIAQYNLCRQPNSASPVVLTNSSANASTADPVDVLGMLLVGSVTVHAGLSLTGIDSSQPAGVSVHYGIRAFGHLGSNLMRTGRILIEEWR